MGEDQEMAKRKLRPILSILREVFVWLMPVLIVSSASLLLYFFISAQSHQTGCKERDLRIFGLAIQIVGFALTAWSLSKDAAQDGRNAVINWFISFPRLFVRVFNISLEAGADASDFMDARASVSISDDVPIEVQIKAIKANLVNLFNEQGNLSSKLRGIDSRLRSSP